MFKDVAHAQGTALVVHRPGTRFWPRAIRQAGYFGSPNDDLYHMGLGVYPTQVLKVVDFGDANCPPFSLESSHQAIQAKVTEDGVRIVFLGKEDINRSDRVSCASSEFDKEHFPANEFIDFPVLQLPIVTPGVLGPRVSFLLYVSRNLHVRRVISYHHSLDRHCQTIAGQNFDVLCYADEIDAAPILSVLLLDRTLNSFKVPLEQIAGKDLTRSYNAIGP